MFKLLGIAAAMILAGNGAGKPAVEPIRLVAEPGAQGVRVQVIGQSVAAYRASFTLEVSRNGNRSLHRGSASLAGGEPVLLSTVTVGGAEPGEWRATLRVEPESGDAYEQVRTS